MTISGRGLGLSLPSPSLKITRTLSHRMNLTSQIKPSQSLIMSGLLMLPLISASIKKTLQNGSRTILMSLSTLMQRMMMAQWSTARIRCTSSRIRIRKNNLWFLSMISITLCPLTPKLLALP